MTAPVRGPRKGSPLLTFAWIFVFIGLSRVAGAVWGDDARLKLLFIAIAVAVFLAAVVGLLQRALWRRLSELHPAELEQLRVEDPEIDDVLADRPRLGERKDWAWRVYRIGWLPIAMFYPPAVTILLRTGHLSLESEFTVVELAAMLLGVATYVLVGRWRLKHYRCRRCGSLPVRLAGETPRYSCARCGIVWNLGSW